MRNGNNDPACKDRFILRGMLGNAWRHRSELVQRLNERLYSTDAAREHLRQHAALTPKGDRR
jgi:hypothetical protein